MAHLENGFSKIANATLEALARTRLSSAEQQILNVVFRMTYGYSRKWARISYRIYSRSTGLAISSCHAAEKKLRDRNIIRRKGERVKFQKYSEKWKSVRPGGNTDKRLKQLRAQYSDQKKEIVLPGANVRSGANEIVRSGANTLNKKEILIKTHLTEFVKIWDGVLEKAQRRGRLAVPKFEDPILTAVVKEIGWSAICNHRPRYEGRKLKERFLDLYAEETIKRGASE